MTRTIAIFGAGPGLGLATARRFGKEGFRVALVARRGERLGSFVAELAGEGIEAKAFAVDLSDLNAHAELVGEITRSLGPIDVAVLNGFLDQSLLRPVLEFDVDAMRRVVDGVFLAPLSLTRLVLPGMVERGDGGLLYGLGMSAKTPLPPLAGPGAGQAGLRNYVYNLNAELAGKGVYAGALTIGVLIRRSDAEALFDSDAAVRKGLEPERADPGDLAERYWDLYTRRDRVEDTVGSFDAG